MTNNKLTDAALDECKKRLEAKLIAAQALGNEYQALNIAATISALTELKERRKANLWCPDVDPITRYPLFMWIEHPALGYVPTYGGPYDSYTLAERDENGEFFRHRYDHDFGGWVEDEYVGLIVVEDWIPKNEKELEEYVRDNQPGQQ